MELRKINREDAFSQWEYTTSLPKDENGLTSPYNGIGLAMTLEIARSVISEDEIYLRLLKTNIASLRVMEKNGAKCVGEDNTHLFMRIAK